MTFIEEREEYPLHDYEITTTPNDFNMLTIISFIKSKVFKIPEFQRHYVWDIKRASKLIESLLIGLPIPQIFLYESGRNEFLVIDGQQRLMSIYYFMEGRFPRKDKRGELRDIFDNKGYIPDEVISDDKYFQNFNLKLTAPNDSTVNKFDGKNYQTLGDYQMTLNLATIRNMVIKPLQGDKESAAMFEIFNRLNSGGINLSNQEIRMSLYNSKFMTTLIELNKNHIWRNIIDKDFEDLRLADVEFVLRAFSMLIYREHYTNSITGFLNKFADHAKNISDDDINKIKDIWISFLNTCLDLTSQDFQTGANRISITLFESVFYACCIDSYNNNIEVLKPSKIFLNTLKKDSDFIKHSTDKTTSRTNVIGRLNRAKEILTQLN